MADLTNTVRWVPYAPDLLGNHDLEQPFYFELNGSMSKEQQKALEADLNKGLQAREPLAEDATPEQVDARDEEIHQEIVAKYASMLSPFVRFGAEPLVIDGEVITTLQRYFAVITARLPGLAMFREPTHALMAANRLDVNSSFFSGRFSGGFTSTTRKSGGRVGGQTAAR